MADVAVLGGGILGVCTALELADRGHHVAVFEQHAEALTEASLHNEGKLHLGFVYAADPTRRTAARMMSGASRFLDVLSRWIPVAALRDACAKPFDYVVHRDSMLPVPAIEAHFHAVADLLREHVRMDATLPPFDRTRPVWRRLTARELQERYSPALVIAAFETCEIAVDPWQLASHLRTALAAHPRITWHGRTRVVRVEKRVDGRFQIVHRGDSGRVGAFDGVVNALWANRAAIDERSGLSRQGRWFTRRKLGVNLLLDSPRTDLPACTIMLGPFGDLVSYQSGRVYLSWYPSCLIGASTGSEETDWPAVLAGVDTSMVQRDTIRAIADICPAVRSLEPFNGRVIVNGGSICAQADTDIVDPASQLHERLDTGIDARGAYVSADTSKFTMAPAIADAIATHVSARVGVTA